MTCFYLVRHASHDLLGRVLAGRMPGVHLNARGRQETDWLRERFRSVPVDAIVTSPLERSLETADPIASALGLVPQIEPALLEMAFGEWTGRSFEELEKVPGWRAFNTCRSVTPVPGGETMLQTQVRAVAALERLRERHADGNVLVVSHGDVFRAVVAHYLGLCLDLLQRFMIEPASITTLHVAGHGATLVRLNDSPPAFEAREDSPSRNGSAAPAERPAVAR
ncbi:MAG TPA: histidine phosphatase family protein [Candidatus Binatia bacterium]|nr:histidine phosphatase family protein [Candidatus Binatia bacterium]